MDDARKVLEKAGLPWDTLLHSKVESKFNNIITPHSWRGIYLEELS